MSKIAILADIHANLPALEAVLRDVEKSGATRIVFLGDIIGYGMDAKECVDLVRRHGGECVMGNHEMAFLRIRKAGNKALPPGWEKSGYFTGIVRAVETLSQGDASWIASLPFTLKIPGAIVAHANLHEPEGFEGITDLEAAAATLAELDRGLEKVGFFGHTHVQRVFCSEPDKIQWLDDGSFYVSEITSCMTMVGSVGEPLEENDPLAAWVLWNSEERVVELRKTATEAKLKWIDQHSWNS